MLFDNTVYRRHLVFQIWKNLNSIIYIQDEFMITNSTVRPNHLRSRDVL
jgi:hypothetical protein